VTAICATAVGVVRFEKISTQINYMLMFFVLSQRHDSEKRLLMVVFFGCGNRTPQVTFGKLSKHEYSFLEIDTGSSLRIFVSMVAGPTVLTAASTTISNTEPTRAASPQTSSLPPPTLQSPTRSTITPFAMTTGFTIVSFTTDAVSSTTTSGVTLATSAGIVPTGASASNVSPATSQSEMDGALIGGTVGGAVALLLVGGLIALYVARRRRAKENKGGDPAEHASGVPLQNNYGRIDIPPISHYSGVIVHQPANHNHYDVLSPSEVGSLPDQQSQQFLINNF
jgi:hypothetical protein